MHVEGNRVNLSYQIIVMHNRLLGEAHMSALRCHQLSAKYTVSSSPSPSLTTYPTLLSCDPFLCGPIRTSFAPRPLHCSPPPSPYHIPVAPLVEQFNFLIAFVIGVDPDSNNFGIRVRLQFLDLLFVSKECHAQTQSLNLSRN